MKVVILAGGFGTRISEESHLRPKPMIEIGGKPILWHIMKEYSHYGFNEFIICAGYKQEVIKEYFANYYLHNCDVTFDFANENDLINVPLTEGGALEGNCCRHRIQHHDGWTYQEDKRACRKRGVLHDLR